MFRMKFKALPVVYKAPNDLPWDSDFTPPLNHSDVGATCCVLLLAFTYIGPLTMVPQSVRGTSSRFLLTLSVPSCQSHVSRFILFSALSTTQNCLTWATISLGLVQAPWGQGCVLLFTTVASVHTVMPINTYPVRKSPRNKLSETQITPLTTHSQEGLPPSFSGGHKAANWLRACTYSNGWYDQAKVWGQYFQILKPKSFHF